ncbi:ABC transporter permease subunit [Nocardioides sp. 616]|uniref:PhnE/PtxC family ABC transporter permease n=1 Tax=Nocardioides sp. 616 TaxID=2268090 RepID=UPI000CE47252|nr:ABC transporter permease subunit [Nocardioides sp. 616]
MPDRTLVDLGAVSALEATAGPGRPARPGRSAAARRRRVRLAWICLWVLSVIWSVHSFVSDRDGVLNSGGLAALTEFWAHALTPETSPDFLRATWDATLTTLAFAVLGTLLSVAVGLALAPALSQTWWRPAGASTPERVLRRAGLLLTRVTLALPRGVHEAVWGLLLLTVLGRDPLVGVLAIAIPFGAITAKVYAEMLDEADHAPYDLLRAAGAGRVTAMAYGLAPGLVPGLTSYAFYRFECSIRSAVILGMIGAGGLGLQLSLSFAGLQYGEMWTSILALVVLGALVDRWGALLRRSWGGPAWRLSGVGFGLLAVASWWSLAPDPGGLVTERTRVLFARLADEMLPPRLPDGGWSELASRSVETVQMSVVAISLAVVLGVAVSLVAARTSGSPAGRVLGWGARQLLLLTRAIPPPVWALLVLFVVFPGPLPGALALGIYTFGILGRLFAEVVEDLDPRPREALSALGASAPVSFAYATVPAAAGQMIAYSLYRWEVTVRETVVVGIVGAGGLGRLLEQQRAGFDYPGMASTILALIAVCVAVDLLSMTVRTSLR